MKKKNSFTSLIDEVINYMEKKVALEVLNKYQR